MLARLRRLEQFGIKLGLSNIARLCEALGHPERTFVSLHVAGTNGKGSVTAMAHAALVSAGIHAARYTSPHLVHLNERFVLGSAPVSDAQLEAVANDVLDVADALVATGGLPSPPTFFEATTAIAFELFRRARVEAAVIEVGLGGRFDATNILSPMAGAIVSIGLDHQPQLGETLSAIAFEKAGIIKPGLPLVCGDLPAEADEVVRREAAARGALLVRARDDATVEVEMNEGRATIRLRTPAHAYGALQLALPGEHQVENALVAVRLLELAKARGLSIPFDDIARGVTQVEWPARLEYLELPDNRRVLIDAAHNPDGACALARHLQRWHPERPPLVFAAMRDKDIDGILRALLPATGPFVVTAPAMTRAEHPEVLAAHVRALDPLRRVDVVPDPLQAVERAVAQGPLACVAGSIFLAGAVREALAGRAILP